MHNIDMNAEAKEEGERKGTLRDVCGAGWWGLRTSSKVFWSDEHSFLYQQPIDIIMAASKVVILTGASRGKKKQDMKQEVKIDGK